MPSDPQYQDDASFEAERAKAIADDQKQKADAAKAAKKGSPDKTIGAEADSFNSTYAKDLAGDKKKNADEAKWEKEHPGEVLGDDGQVWSTDPSKWTPEQASEFQRAMGVLSTPGVTKGLVVEGEHGKQLADLPPGGVVGQGQGPPSQAGQGGSNTAPATTSTAAAQTSAAAQAANSMMQALAGEYTGMMSSMQPFMSGAAGEQAGAAAGAMGAAAAGGGVQAQNPTYAAQLAGPQNTVAQAMAAGSKDIAQGVSDLGQADAAYMQTAPYQGLLSALQSEGQYKVETGAATPNVTNTPKWAQAAYADVLGAAPAGASSTTTPQSQLAAQQAAQQAAQTSPSSENQSAPGQAGGSA